MRTTAGEHPNAAGGNMLQMYWTLTSFGVTQADLTFNWAESEVEGTDATYELAKYDGAWIFPGGTFNPLTNTASIDNQTSFSDWTCGDPGALPIQLVFFSASLLRHNDVEIAWHTVSETNNYGFEIERRRSRYSVLGSRYANPRSPIENPEWVKIGFVAGQGTTLEPQSYSYIDRNVPFGRYYYRIKQIDLDGRSETFPEMEVSVGVGPDKFVLAQNYPNPFNPSTVIEFVVPQTGQTTVKVYNILGQEVATLFEGIAEAGEINAALFDASRLPSGIYFYRLNSVGKVETRRMMLMK